MTRCHPRPARRTAPLNGAEATIAAAFRAAR